MIVNRVGASLNSITGSVQLLRIWQVQFFRPTCSNAFPCGWLILIPNVQGGGSGVSSVVSPPQSPGPAAVAADGGGPARHLSPLVKQRREQFGVQARKPLCTPRVDIPPLRGLKCRHRHWLVRWLFLKYCCTMAPALQNLFIC